MKQYRFPKRSTHANTDYMAQTDYPHRFAPTLLEMAAQKGRNAILTDRIAILYYQRLLSGRLCSCWEHSDALPIANCKVCFGAGRVGGYNVIGTAHAVVDITAKTHNVGVNIIQNRPGAFQLGDGIKHGDIFTEITLQSNIRTTDLIKLFADTIPDKNQIGLFIKAPSDAAFVLCTPGTLQERLHEQKILLKASLERDTLNDPSPTLYSIYLRYKISNTQLYVDIPRQTASNLMEELGIESYEQTQAWFDGSILSYISTEDFVIFNKPDYRYYKVRFKIQTAQDFKPLGINLGFDTTIRKILSNEPQSRVP